MSSHGSNCRYAREPVFNWIPYYQLVANQKTSTSLQAAMALPDLFVPGRENFAADLGSGEGRDTLELLAQGWHVVAVDNTHVAMEKLAERAAELNLSSRLQTVEASFATADWGIVDLVTANLSLPYCPPELFQSLWQRIASSLRPGGILTTQLFGDRHSAAQMPFVNTFTRAQVEELLKPFDVTTFKEVETPGQWANSGKPINIHEFQILARKREDSSNPSDRNICPSPSRSTTPNTTAFSATRTQFGESTRPSLWRWPIASRLRSFVLNLLRFGRGSSAPTAAKRRTSTTSPCQSPVN